LTTKRWILIFLAILLVCLAILALQSKSRERSTVTVIQDGVVVQTIDLRSVKETYSFSVSYKGSINVVCVSPDTVWVSEADCSNQVCVDHGPLQPGGSPITCLPNHLIIRWANSGVDG